MKTKIFFFPFLINAGFNSCPAFATIYAFLVGAGVQLGHRSFCGAPCLTAFIPFLVGHNLLKSIYI